MAAVISGEGLGLFNSSLDLLGKSSGNSQLGQFGDKAYINSTSGNLVIQQQDEFLSSLGLDLALARTYNSQGQFDGDNNDNWRLNVYQQLHSLTGTVNAASSTITKVMGDGHETVYSYDVASGKYLSNEGSGAEDSLSYNATTTEWTWTSGDSGISETFDASGQLLSKQDIDGNTHSYIYSGSLITEIQSTNINNAEVQSVFLDYTGNNLSQIRTVSDGQTQTRTHYSYDTQDRLEQVIVDLTPEDNDITDANTFTTTYTYDGTSNRVASITSGDGTRIAFTYDVQGRVETYTDGADQTTTFSYSDLTEAVPTTATADNTQLNDTNATDYTLDNGQLNTTDTADYGINNGALSTTDTADYAVDNGALSTTDTVDHDINSNALSTTDTTDYTVNNGALSTTDTVDHNINSGALSTTDTADYAVNNGALSTTDTADYAVNNGGLSTTDTADYAVNNGALSTTDTADYVINNGALSTTDTADYAVNNGALSTTDTADYTINNGALSTTDTADYTINNGALSTTDTADYAINNGALSTTDTADYAINNGALNTTDTADYVINGSALSITDTADYAVNSSALSTADTADYNLNSSALSTTDTQISSVDYLLDGTALSSVVVPGTLQNGVAIVDLAGLTGEEINFTFEVPLGASQVSFIMSGGAGDADLYIKHGSAPTTSVYDYRPYLNGNNETVTVATPAAGTWHVMVRAYNDYSGASLTSQYSFTDAETSLTNNDLQTGLTGLESEQLFYKIEVPAGATDLNFQMSGGTGDADLYVRYGSSPTLSNYDYRPYLNGNNETVSVAAPTAGTWYVMVEGYTDFSGVSLNTSYIYAGNEIPVVDAGIEQYVVPSDVVTISGSAVDVDGTISSYNWTQVNGPNVSLTTPNSASTSFTAPLISSSTVLQFQLTVTDNLGATQTDIVSVIVEPVGGEYIVQSGDTWASIATLLYGTADVADELQTLLGNPILTAGNSLSGFSATLTDTISTIINVPEYYRIQTGDTWASIATTLYGTANVADELETALGSPALTVGTDLTGIPASLTDTFTVAPYYRIQTGDTWASIATTLFGTANVADELEAALGSPALTVGTDLTGIPATLTDTFTVAPYYRIQTGDTWASIAITLYGTANVSDELQAALLDPPLTVGTDLSGIPTTLTDTVTVAPYYRIQTGDTWASIATTLYGTANVADELQAALFDPPLTVGTDLTGIPASLTDTFTVAPYYRIKTGDTWASIATTLYGTANVADELEAALGNPTLTVGSDITTAPASLTDTITVAPYYRIQTGDTWASIATTLFGTANVADELEAALGSPALTVGTDLTGIPATLTDTITVAPYYRIQTGDTWASIATTLYGTANVADELQAALLDPPLTVGTDLTGIPASLTDTVTVAPYYRIQTGDTWASIATTLYGTANVADELQAALLDPPLTVGTDLTGIPASLTDTVTAAPYYRIQTGDTWASIATTLYGTANVADELQAALGNPALTVGTDLTGIPGTLTDTITVAPYYHIQTGDTWASIATTLFSTDLVADELQSALGNPTLTVGTDLTGIPASLTDTFTVAPYYRIQTGDTWASIAMTLFGTANVADELQAALLDPPLTVGTDLTGIPASLTDTVTVAPYYRIQTGDTWASIATTLYGTANVADELQAALLDPPLTVGTDLTGIPASLTDTVTVAPYYRIQTGDTWASIATTLYGTANVADELQAALGNPALTVGTDLTGIPGTLTDTITVAPYYRIQSGDTWTSIATTLYGTANVADELQAALLDPPLTVGTDLTGIPASLTDTYTVAPYYRIQSGDTWASIATTLYGTANVADELEAALGNPTLTVGSDITTAPASLTDTVTVAPYYRIQTGDTWASIATTLFGTDLVADELQAALGNPILTVGTDLTGNPASLTDTVTVAPYYRIQTGDTWTSIATTLYGTANVADELQAALLDPPLTVGTDLSGIPTTLTDTITVAPYYRIQTGDTWASIATTLYGTANVADELQAALGNPTLTVGTDLTSLPTTLTNVVTVAPYYIVQTGDTWDAIALTVYGDAQASSALQSYFAGQGVTSLTVGDLLTVPSNIDFAANVVIGTQTDVVDPLGYTTSYNTNFDGQLVETLSHVVNGARLSIQYNYNAAGDIENITDGNGNIVNYQYDANGNLIQQQDSAGNTVKYTYSTSNKLENQTVYLNADPDGLDPTNTGLLGSATTPLTTRNVYDIEDHLRFSVSAEGHVSEYQYNASGERISTITYAAASYDISLLTETDTLTEVQLQTWVGLQDLTQAQRIDYTYDFRGNLDTTTTYSSIDATGNGVIDGTQRVTQLIYDQANQLVQSIEARGTATTAIPDDYITYYTYDGLGRLRTTTDALNNTTITNYNDVNNLTTTTLANGLATTSVYDARGLLISQTQTAPDATALGTTTYTYNKEGQLRFTQDPLGQRDYVLYDEAGRVIATVDTSGAIIETVYDDVGNVLQAIAYANSLSTTTLTTLSATDINGDLLNIDIAALRLEASTTEDRISTVIYDETNRPVITLVQHDTDVTLAYATQNFYDGAGRITDVIQYATNIDISLLPANPVPDNVIMVADLANDRHSRVFYNNDGQVIASLDAAGYLTENTYNEAGQLTASTRFATQLTDQGLHSSGDLTTIKTTIATSVNDRSSYSFYNSRGEMIASIDADNYLTEYGYDLAGNQTDSVRYDTTVNYTGTETLAQLRPVATNTDHASVSIYDDLNRISTTTNVRDNTTTEFVYDNVSNLIETTFALNTSEVRTLRTQYDAAGRVKASLTAEGSAAFDLLLEGAYTQKDIDTLWATYGVSHTYDANGRLLTTTDQNGSTTWYYYDDNDRLSVTIQSVDGGKNSSGTTIINEGDVSQLTYNSFGQVMDITQFANRIDTTGLVGGSVTDADIASRLAALGDSINDSRSSVNYTLRGAVKTAFNSENYTTTNTYNTFGEKATSTTQLDKLATPTTVTNQYDYDKRGLLNSTLEDITGKNRLTQVTYDAFGRISQTIDGNANSSSVVYSTDGLGRKVVTTTDSLFNNIVTTYDAFDRVLTQTDKNNNTVTYNYDDTTRSVTILTQEGISTKTVKNRHGETVLLTDGNQNQTQYDYDKNGNLKTITEAVGSADEIITQNNNYDNANRLIETTDARGVITKTQYDAANRVIKQTRDPIDATTNPNGLNITTEYRYDAKGQMVHTTGANGTVTTTEYDKRGQVKAVTVEPNGLNLRTEYTYDGRGKTLTVTEAVGTVDARTTEYQYDKLGRRTHTIIDPEGLILTTKYDYDNNDNVVAMTDANNNVTRYVYDKNDQQTYSVNAEGGVVKTEYKNNGLVEKTIRYANEIDVSGFALQITETDITAQLVTSNSDRIDRYAYDNDNRLTFTVNSIGAVVETNYDNNGNVISTIAYANQVNTAGIDGAGDRIAHVASLLVEDNTQDRSSRVVYDHADRAVFSMQVFEEAGISYANLTEYAYDDNGNMIATASYATKINLTTATFADPLSPSINEIRALIQTDSVNDRGSVYVYDNANRQRYSIDALGNISETIYDNKGNIRGVTDYALSLNGVAILISAGIDPTNYTAEQIRAILPTVLTEDSINAGIVSDPKDQTTRYVYDNADRLTYTISALGYVTQSGFDALGNNTSRTVYASDVAFTDSTIYQTETAVDNIIQASLLSRTDNQTYKEQITTTNYNSLNLMSDRTSAVGELEEYTEFFDYDQNGNLLRYTNGNGDSEYYAYDALNQETRSIDFEGYVIDKTYTTFGDVASKRTYMNNVVLPTVDDVRFAYNTADPVKNVDANTGDRTTFYQYDSIGQLVATEEAGLKEYAVDATIQSSASVFYDTYTIYFTGENIINLTWPSASAWGSGDLRIEVDYIASNDKGSKKLTREVIVDTALNEFGTTIAWTPNDSISFDYQSTQFLDFEALESIEGFRIWSEENNQSTLVYDTSVSEPNITKYSYNSFGELTTTTEAKGTDKEVITYNEYDALGRLRAESSLATKDAAWSELTNLGILGNQSYTNGAGSSSSIKTFDDGSAIAYWYNNSTATQNFSVYSESSGWTPLSLPDTGGNLVKYVASNGSSTVYTWRTYDSQTSIYSLHMLKYVNGEGWLPITTYDTTFPIDLNGTNRGRLTITEQGDIYIVETDTFTKNQHLIKYSRITGWELVDVTPPDGFDYFYKDMVVKPDGSIVGVFSREVTGYIDRDIIHLAEFNPTTGWQYTRLTDADNVSGRDVNIGLSDSGEVLISWRERIWRSGLGFGDAIFAKYYSPGTGWSTAESLVESFDKSLITTEPYFDNQGNVIFSYGIVDVASTANDRIFTRKYNSATGWDAAILVDVTEQISSIAFTSSKQNLNITTDNNGDLTYYLLQEAGLNEYTLSKYSLVNNIWEFGNIISRFNTDTNIVPRFDITSDGKISYVLSINNGSGFELHGAVLNNKIEPDSKISYNYDTFGNQISVAGPRAYEITTKDTIWALSEREKLGYTLIDSGTGLLRAKLAGELTVTEIATLNNKYTTGQEFDTLNRKTAAIDALGGRTDTSYDSFGNIVSAIDPSIATGYFYYDSLNRTNFQINSEGYATQLVYDSRGNVVETIQYANKVVGVYDATTEIVILDVEPVSNPPLAYVVRNAENDQHTYANYDVLNRTTSIADAESYTEDFTYDSTSNVLTHTDKNRNFFVYKYDAVGNKTNEYLPVTSDNGAGIQTQVVNEFSYDAIGNKIQVTNSLGLPEESTTQFAYNKLSQLVETIETTVITAAEVAPTVAETVETFSNGFVDANITKTVVDFNYVVDATIDFNGFTLNGYGVNAPIKVVLKSLGNDTPGSDIIPDTVESAYITNPTTISLSLTTSRYFNGGLYVEPRETILVFYTMVDGVEYQLKTGEQIQGSVGGKIFDVIKLPPSMSHAKSVQVRLPSKIYYDRVTGSQTSEIDIPITIPGQFSIPLWNNFVFEADVYDANGELLGVIAGEADAGTGLVSTTIASVVAHIQDQEISPSNNISYDELGNVKKQIDANGNETHFYYDLNNNLSAVIDAERYYHAYSYDPAGNKVSERTYADKVPLNTSTGSFYELDSNIPPEPIWDVNGYRETLYSYDENNNLIETRIKSVNVYDRVNGERTEDLVTSYKYDAKSNLVQVTDPNGGSAFNVFNSVGDKLYTIDALGYIVKYEHDAFGNVIKETQIANNITDAELSALSLNNISTELERLATLYFSAKDKVVMHGYDNLNQNTSSTLKDVNVSEIDATTGILTSAINDVVTQYQYDGNGNVNKLINADNSVNDYQYDARNLLTSELGASYTSINGVVRQQTDYDYDGNGNLVRQTAIGTLNNNQVTQYKYDAHGNLIEEIDQLGANTKYYYDVNSNIILTSQRKTNADGSIVRIETPYEYDALNRQVKTTTARAIKELLLTTETGGSVSQFVKYNAYGEIVEKGINGISFEYAEYDNAGRLLRSNSGDGTYRIYKYDANGNKTAQVGAFGKEYEYDANGNLIAEYTPTVDVNIPTDNYWSNVLPNGFENTFGIDTSYIEVEQGEINTTVDYIISPDTSTTDKLVINLPPFFGYGDGDFRIEYTPQGGIVPTQAKTVKNGTASVELIIDSSITIALPRQIEIYKYVNGKPLRVASRNIFGISGTTSTSTVDEPMKIHFKGLPAETQSVSMYFWKEGDVKPTTATSLARIDQGWFSMARPDLTGIPGGTTYNFEYQVLDSSGAEIDSYRGTMWTTGYPGELIEQTHEKFYANKSSGELFDVQRYSYDAYGNLITDTKALGENLATRDGVWERSKRIERGYAEFAVDLTEADRTALRQIYTTEYEYNKQDLLVTETKANVSVIKPDNTAANISPVENRYYDIMGRNIGFMNSNEYLKSTLNPIYEPKISRKLYDEAGNLTKEIYENETKKSYQYDEFGNLRSLTNEVFRVTSYQYDDKNQLVELIRPFNSELGKSPVETFEYDELGRRIARTNARGHREEIYFDSAGNLVKSIDFSGVESKFTNIYDDVNNVYINRDETRRTSTETDFFGRVVRDVDGVTYNEYTYSNGKLLQKVQFYNGLTGEEWRSNISYKYDAAGNLKETTNKYNQYLNPNGVGLDSGISSSTGAEYTYDANGNRISEVSYQDSDNGRIYQQQTRVKYDELDRIITIDDPDFAINYNYDANGNRVHTYASYQNGAGGIQDYWYEYDVMDRFTTARGTLENGVVVAGADGKTITYNDDGSRNTVNRERYEYNSDGVLSKIFIDNNLRVRRWYDAVGNATKQVEYSAAGATTKTSTYTYTNNNQVLRDTINDTIESTTTEYVYGDLGQLVEKWTKKPNFFTYTYNHYTDSAKTKLSRIRISGDVINYTPEQQWKPGYSNFIYDATDTNLLYLDDVVDGRRLTYLYNTEGQIIQRTQLLGKDANQEAFSNSEVLSQRFYYFNGSPIGDAGDYGNSENDYIEILASQEAAKKDKQDKREEFRKGSNFDYSFKNVSNYYPGLTSGSYTVHAKDIGASVQDSLKNIALTVWGDSSLWYLIADSNGLVDGATLTEGENLVIPNVVTNQHNNSNTFKVYNPGELIGNTSPTLPDAPPPPPPSSNGCGIIGKIIVIVVTAVVTYYAGQAAGQYVGATLGAAIGAAVGSIAGQVVAVGLGMQKEINWDQVGVSAVTAGILKGANFNYSSAAANAVAKNVVNQVVNKAFDSDYKFSWRSIAVSAISAEISEGISNDMAPTNAAGSNTTTTTGANWDGFKHDLGVNFVQSFVAESLTTLAYKDHKFSWDNVAVQAVNGAVQGALGAEDRLSKRQKAEQEYLEKMGGPFLPSAGTKAQRDAQRTGVTIPNSQPDKVASGGNAKDNNNGIRTLADGSRIDANGNWVGNGDSAVMYAGLGKISGGGSGNSESKGKLTIGSDGLSDEDTLASLKAEYEERLFAEADRIQYQGSWGSEPYSVGGDTVDLSKVRESLSKLEEQAYDDFRNNIDMKRQSFLSEVEDIRAIKNSEEYLSTIRKDAFNIVRDDFIKLTQSIAIERGDIDEAGLTTKGIDTFIGASDLGKGTLSVNPLKSADTVYGLGKSGYEYYQGNNFEGNRNLSGTVGSFYGGTTGAILAASICSTGVGCIVLGIGAIAVGSVYGEKGGEGLFDEYNTDPRIRDFDWDKKINIHSNLILRERLNGISDAGVLNYNKGDEVKNVVINELQIYNRIQNNDYNVLHDYFKDK